MRPNLPVSGLLLVLAVPALAKTPDGKTPAEETVCDDYRGAAFGLCNAYCEAMDCDDPDTRASDRACERVADNFARKTGGDELPCEATEIEVCTIEARDDFFELSVEGPFDLDVLANDVVKPESAELTIDSDTAPGTLTESEGVYSGSWGGEFLYETFEYTACCNEETCDTAMVTILGS